MFCGNGIQGDGILNFGVGIADGVEDHALGLVHELATVRKVSTDRRGIDLIMPIACWMPLPVPQNGSLEVLIVPTEFLIPYVIVLIVLPFRKCHFWKVDTKGKRGKIKILLLSFEYQFFSLPEVPMPKFEIIANVLVFLVNRNKLRRHAC